MPEKTLDLIEDFWSNCYEATISGVVTSEGHYDGPFRKTREWDAPDPKETDEDGNPIMWHYIQPIDVYYSEGDMFRTKGDNLDVTFNSNPGAKWNDVNASGRNITFNGNDNENDVVIHATNLAKVTTGNANDTISASGNTFEINAGGGKNIINASGNKQGANSHVTTGDDDDHIIVTGDSNVVINAGAGND